MKKIKLLFVLLAASGLQAQEVSINEIASLEQIYGKRQKSKELLPMNELDIDFGYVLYQTEITISEKGAVLEVEHIRDFGAVYVDALFQGVLSFENSRLALAIEPGTYTLHIYTENIGRITYGPEILDNMKGLWGESFLNGKPVKNWTMTELKIRDCAVNSLQFISAIATTPSFHKGYFTVENPKNIYIDISGWGMGEVWINGDYLGSYSDEEQQQSIQIPASSFIEGQNEIVLFDLKNKRQTSVRLVDEPVFK